MISHNLCQYNPICYAQLLVWYSMMSIRQKVLNAISAHPKLAAFAMGLAITIVVGTVMGTLDVHSVYADYHAGFGTNVR